MAAREGRKHCGICRPIGPVSGHAQCKAADVVEPRPFIIAMGASAGGLEALERFFGSLPSDTGMAFVVIQHLSRTSRV
jgi:chemotaxis response regulator CheB